MINKVSPYSQMGIHKAIYHMLIEDWSGLSNINSVENDNFSGLIGDVIAISSEQANYFFDKSLLGYINTHKKNRMVNKNEHSTKSFETKELEKLTKTLKSLLLENEEFDFLEFNNLVYSYVKNKYNGLDVILPKRLSKINEDNIEDQLLEIKSNLKTRLSSFKGFSYKRKESFHFVDAITAPIVYYNKTNDISPIETMIIGISSYVLKLTEVKNTKLIIKRLEEIEKNDLKVDHKNFNFGQFSKIKKASLPKEKISSKDVDRILKRKID